MRRICASLALSLIVVACRSAPSPGVGAGVRFPAKLDRSGPATIVLEGATWGSGRAAVVFAHSFGATQDEWALFARTVAGRGFLAVTFNFRGYGLSEGDKDPSGADLDLEAAVAFATTKGATRIFVVGASMGGTAAIVAGARLGLAGIVVLSAPATFRGLDALSAAPKVEAGVLFIAAADDPGGAAASARSLAATVPDPKGLEIVRESDAHGTALLEGSDGRRVQTEIVQFLIDRAG